MNLLLMVSTVHHRIEWVGGGFVDCLDVPAEELIGRTIDDVLAISSRSSWDSILAGLDSTVHAIEVVVWRLVSGSGSTHRFEVRNVQSFDGGLTALISLKVLPTDSSELVRGAETGVVIHDGRRILSTNQVAARMIGLDVKQLVGLPTESFISTADIPQLVMVRGALADDPTSVQSVCLDLLGPRGVHVPVNASITLVSWEGIDAVQVVIEEIGALRGTEPAVADATNLSIDSAAVDTDESSAVILIGIDQIGTLDAEFGRAAADTVALELIGRLAASLRGTDSVTRLGTARLVAHVEIESRAEALSIAERIQGLVAEPVDIDGSWVTIAASFGAAYGSAGNAAGLREDAESALGRARAEGGRRLCWYEPVIEVHGWDDDPAFIADVRAAVASGDMYVTFQPIVELRDGQLRRLEALARWDHPVHGAIPPSVFIPLAERTGAINELGDWILSKACHDAVRMEADGIEVDISVNVSVVQLRQPDLTGRVAAVLASSGLSSRRLGVEVTESVLLDEQALASLHDLHAMGVQLVIDDFGTGHANFQYLSRLPVDALKIDMTFVAGLGIEPRDTAIVRSVVSLARELGLAVVAEGVETESQRLQLLGLNCRFGQGWLFSRALRYDALVAAYGATGTASCPIAADLAGNAAESLRVAALKASKILDTDPEPAFDALVALASQLLTTPIALVSLIDADRQWFKARVGLDITETARDGSFCAASLAAPDTPLIVTDASKDERFARHPMVTSARHVRSYAGVLIRSREGLPLGTLCVIDTEPRVFSDDQVAQLALLAEQAAALIDLRRRAAELDDLYCRAGKLNSAGRVIADHPSQRSHGVSRNGAISTSSAKQGAHVREQLRLAALEACAILDSSPDAAFDSLVRLAARLLSAPVAGVALVASNRQWFKAIVGLELVGTPRHLAFSTHAIKDPHDAFIVADTALDARFCDNPLVVGAPFIRSYLGMPICSREGWPLGTLSVLDVRPREFTAEEVNVLKVLALQAAALLDLRRRAGELNVMIAPHAPVSIDDAQLRAVLDNWKGHVNGDRDAGSAAVGVRSRLDLGKADAMTVDPEAAALRLAATRALLRAEGVADAVSVCVRLVSDLGGWTIPARLDDGRALPIDCSFGNGEPIFAVPGSALSRIRLERILPDLLEDARGVVCRVRERDELAERTRVNSIPEGWGAR